MCQAFRWFPDRDRCHDCHVHACLHADDVVVFADFIMITFIIFLVVVIVYVWIVFVTAVSSFILLSTTLPAFLKKTLFLHFRLRLRRSLALNFRLVSSSSSVRFLLQISWFSVSLLSSSYMAIIRSSFVRSPRNRRASGQVVACSSVRTADPPNAEEESPSLLWENETS